VKLVHLLLARQRRFPETAQCPEARVIHQYAEIRLRRDPLGQRRNFARARQIGRENFDLCFICRA